MLWNRVIGQNLIKKKLLESVKDGRISHAQLISGSEGSGTLALAVAYAEAILCSDGKNNCSVKVKSLQHPDLHFSYPVATTDSVKDKPTSKMFLKEWRNFYLNNPYGNIFDWLQQLGIAKKQGVINVYEANEIIKTLALNSYEGGYKIMIIWLPEMMNNSSANKLLKIIEEPPKKTVFLLVTEREDLLLPTITSRCQLVKVNRIQENDLSNYLITEKKLSEKEAKRIAYSSQGNLREALLQLQDSNNEFDTYFVNWVRNAFMAAKNPGVLRDLVLWANDLSNWSREEQKEFLHFCSEVFRQALLKNYNTDELVFMNIKSSGFKWDGFAPFIHGANIQDILNEINDASYHIERNANAKIVFLDLSIKLTRYLHRKAANR